MSRAAPNGSRRRAGLPQRVAPSIRKSLIRPRITQSGVNMRLVVFAVAATLFPREGPNAEPTQAPWKVDTTPVFDIVIARHGAHVHPLPVGAVRLTDSTILMASAHDDLILIKPSQGQIRRVGQSGESAGEFRHISWVGRCEADSAFVWDRMRRRMTVLAPNGSIARDYPVPPNETDGPSPETVACSGRGVFAFQPVPGRGGGDGTSVVRGIAPITIADNRGHDIGRIAEVSGSELVQLGGGAGPRPLGKATVLAVGTDRVYIGTSDSASIDVFGLDGRRLPSIAVDVPTRRPSKLNYEQAVEAAISAVPPALSPAIRQWLLRLPIPDSMPPYGALQVDADDVVWVVLSAPGDAQTLVRALDQQGRSIAQVEVPRFIRITEIGRDYILGVYPDGAGQPHLAMYRLQRGH